MSKITMTRDLRGELPALPDFDGLKLHTWNDESAAAWNWIHQSGCMNPTGLEGTGLLPEQVYFSGSFSSDVAAVAVCPGAQGDGLFTEGAHPDHFPAQFSQLSVKSASSHYPNLPVM